MVNQTIINQEKVQNAISMYMDGKNFHYSSTTKQWETIKTIIDSREGYINSPNKDFVVKGAVLKYEEHPEVYDWTNKLGNIQITLSWARMTDPHNLCGDNKPYGAGLINTNVHFEITCQPHRVSQWVSKINNYIQTI